jgi:hypothetical protein
MGLGLDVAVLCKQLLQQLFPWQRTVLRVRLLAILAQRAIQPLHANHLIPTMQRGWPLLHRPSLIIRPMADARIQVLC